MTTLFILIILLNLVIQQQAITDTNNHQKTCFEGKGNRYLKTCIQNCGGDFNEEDEPPSLTLDKHLPSYKLTILQKHQYLITKNNDYLSADIIGIKNISKKYFIKNNEHIYLCIPLLDFISCKVHWLFDPQEYTIDNNTKRLVLKYSNKTYDVSSYVIKSRDKSARVCSEKDDINEEIKKICLLVGWFISLLALGATIICALTISELQLKDNKILLCNLAMLFLTFLFLCIRMLTGITKGPGCNILGHLKQYTLLSAFCWINIQAWDIYLIFFKLRPKRTESAIDKKRYIIYAVHGWGTPLWITTVTVLAEAFDVKYFNPNITGSCWFPASRRLLGLAFLYLYGPIALILIINIVLFVATIYKLWTMGNAQGQITIRKRRLKVYLKLVIVMGLCWIMEIISVAVGGDDWIWLFFDMINAFQGLFIFIVYVCKPSFIRSSFHKLCRNPGCPAWWPLKPIPESGGIRGDTTASTTNNSTLGREVSVMPMKDVQM